MTTQKTEFLSPVGRIVQGHPMEKQDKNMNGQPLVTQSGQPTQRYFVALAFRKDDPAFPAFYAQMVAVSRAAFPHLFNAQGQCVNPRFSMKLMDGDGMDENGKPNANKEGFAGHWVVKFQSSFKPRCLYQGRYKPHEEITDPNLIRKGWFARVAGTMEGNGNPTKPGIYVNLGMFELCAQGPEIVSGPDAATVFGSAPAPALPAGATALPAAGAMPVMPPGAAPMMPATQVPAMAAPQTPVMPTMAAPMMPPPQTPVMPNPAFAAGPGAQPAIPGLPAGLPPTPGAPMAPQPPAPPMMAPPQPPAASPIGAPPNITPTAAWPQGQTWQSMTSAGWTEPIMRQSGYIV